jgi:hypothetical protein
MRRSLLLVLLGALLFGSTSCKKETEKEGLSYVNGVPDYHFTDTDRLWLQARQGDVWKLENNRGYQRAYQVYQIIEHLQEDSRSSSYGIPGSSTLINYYDQVTLRFSRADSANRGGAELRFYRDAAMLANLSSGGYDTQTSQFYVEGEDYEFVGNTDLISDYFSCRGMKFPRGAALNGPFQQLTVRGRTYTDVVALLGTPRGNSCAPVRPAFIQELYYDRQAGLVRMVSLGGEVWDRVP